MFPIQRITLHSHSPSPHHLITSSRKILRSIHVLIFIASLLAKVSYQENVSVAALNKISLTPPSTRETSGDAVQEPLPYTDKKGQNRPKITVESERTSYSDEVIREKVNKSDLYRPLNKSERYLYDGENELHIVQTQLNVCYYITCSAPYIIKWTTTIPLKNLPASSFLERCGAGKYLNSRRLQDPHIHNNNESADRSSHGNNHDDDNKRLSPMYTIQFIFGNFGSNMGLLKCESIENSTTMSTHFYFTEAAGVYTSSLVSYAPSSATQLSPSLFLNAELFLDNNLDRELIVPCRGTSLQVQLDLSMRRLPAWKYGSQRKIWDKELGNLDSKSVEYNVTYDPVLGFAFAYDISPFEEMPLFTVASLDFWCGAEDESTMRYNVYVTSGLQENKGHTSKITIVDDEFEISSETNGCFLVKNSDRFLFFGSRNDLNAQDGHYPLKLINCNSPHECDVFRQCLDFEHKFCYSEQAQLQADMFKLVKPHNRGLLRCFDYGGEIGYKPIYEYTFVGLDRIRYVLSEDIPTKAIIYLDETPSTLLTNVPATFRCQIANFILVANIRFALVFSNKTVRLQSQNAQKPPNPRGQPLSFPRQSGIEMYDTNDVSSVLNANADLGIGWENFVLNLTADVVGVMCFAPLHNSTEWVNVTRSFKAKDIQKPIIKKEATSSRRVFGKGEKDFNLHCESRGAPYPEIKWKLPNTNPNLALSEILDEIGNSFLNFPRMERSFAGTYTCFASNLYGNDSYDFIVDYQESGLGWRENTGIGFAVVFFIGLLISFVALLFKYRNTRRKLRDLTEEEISEFKHGKEGGNKGENYYSKMKAEGKIDISLLPFEKKFILDPNDLMIEKGVILGTGNFGIVYRGLLNGCPVAVKTLKSTADVTFVKSLLSELKIMSFIGDHENIVHFFGAVIEKIQKRAVEAVVELSSFGNLKIYLKNILDSISSSESRFINLLDNDAIVLTHLTTTTDAQESKDKITTLTLVDWCRQIASGMNFLALKRVYHGDLAARNILVFKNHNLKITDFGLSKQLYSSSSYVKKEKIALPWRWMAIETLNFYEFSIESDVWAFGVTIWEIFSLGKFPYPGLKWTPEFITILSSGMRMGKPEYCSKSIHDEMLKCWREKPVERPTFAQLVDFFQRILEENQRLSSTAKDVKEETMANKEVNDSHDSNPVVYSLL